MADVFGKLKSSINRGITTISVKTSSSLEKTKIKTHIDTLEADIQKLIYSAGELSYAIFAGESEDNDKLKTFFETIKQKREEVSELTLELNAIDERDNKILGTNEKEVPAGGCVCSNCGATFDTPMNFCRNCGNKMS